MSKSNLKKYIKINMMAKMFYLKLSTDTHMKHNKILLIFFIIILN